MKTGDEAVKTVRQRKTWTVKLTSKRDRVSLVLVRSALEEILAEKMSFGKAVGISCYLIAELIREGLIDQEDIKRLLNNRVSE